MKVDLAYGRTGLSIEVPEERTTVIEPTYLPGLPDTIGALRNAIRNPIGAPPLRRIVRSSHKVAIAVCDVTRPMPSYTVLPVLLAELKHVPRDQIVILVATGTHRPNTTKELESMLGEEVSRDYRVVNHDAFDTAGLTYMGKSGQGVPIWLNSHWVESDIRITTGFVEPHFFAGFSGGPKMVAPGLAGFDTVMKLHSAALIADPNSTWGVIEGNPIHDAIRDIARETDVDFSVDVTINRDHRITSVYAGELFETHRAACQASRATAMQLVPQPFDVVVTTNSGYPLDLNLYQAVKGMAAAAKVVKSGGTIICAAECSDGIPDHGKYKEILSARRSPRDLLQMVTSEGYAEHDQWQVQLQAQIQLKARVLLKSSFLTPEQVRAAHLEPSDNVEEDIKSEVSARGESARICVLPQGPQTIPYLESDSN